MGAPSIVNVNKTLVFTLKPDDLPKEVNMPAVYIRKKAGEIKSGSILKKNEVIYFISSINKEIRSDKLSRLINENRVAALGIKDKKICSIFLNGKKYEELKKISANKFIIKTKEKCFLETDYSVKTEVMSESQYRQFVESRVKH